MNDPVTGLTAKESAFLTALQGLGLNPLIDETVKQIQALKLDEAKNKYTGVDWAAKLRAIQSIIEGQRKNFETAPRAPAKPEWEAYTTAARDLAEAGEKSMRTIAILDFVIYMPRNTWAYRHVLHLEKQISVAKLRIAVEKKFRRDARLAGLEREKALTLGMIDEHSRAETLRAFLATVPKARANVRGVLSAEAPAMESWKQAREELATLESQIIAARLVLKPEPLPSGIVPVVPEAPSLPPPKVPAAVRPLTLSACLGISSTDSAAVNKAILEKLGGKRPDFVVVLWKGE